MKTTITLILGLILVTGCINTQTKSTTLTTTAIIPLTTIISPSPTIATTTSGTTSTIQQQGNLDDGSLGSLNHAYLQSQPYSKIIIEIDYVSGYEPSTATKNSIRDFFQSMGKQVTFSGGNVITPTKNVYTINDLEAVEDANRQHSTSGDTVVMYYMFINGQFENAGALGVAYKASTAVLFVERIDDATSALILYSQIEKAVAIHEMGHLLGLVNINYKSERNHEDLSHQGHSKNEDSVMFWAVEDISLKNILNLGPPSTFDDDDLFDMQKIKNGDY